MLRLWTGFKFFLIVWKCSGGACWPTKLKVWYQKNTVHNNPAVASCPSHTNFTFKQTGNIRKADMPCWFVLVMFTLRRETQLAPWNTHGQPLWLHDIGLARCTCKHNNTIVCLVIEDWSMWKYLWLTWSTLKRTHFSVWIKKHNRCSPKIQVWWILD